MPRARNHAIRCFIKCVPLIFNAVLTVYVFSALNVTVFAAAIANVSAITPSPTKYVSADPVLVILSVARAVLESCSIRSSVVLFKLMVDVPLVMVPAY